MLTKSKSIFQHKSLVFLMYKDVFFFSHGQDHCLSVCLCDTTTSKDIHINDTLVSQGLAVFVPDTVDDEANYDNYQLEPPPSEVLTD